MVEDYNQVQKISNEFLPKVVRGLQPPNQPQQQWGGKNTLNHKMPP